MVTQITNNIQVSVETFYQEDHSSPLNHEFAFAYRITIENFSEWTIRLLQRHWMLFDSCGIHREVSGEGVIGQQPIIESGKAHQYVSGVNLRTEIGKMQGYYLMERLSDGKYFTVKIPEFNLIAPFKMS